MPKQRRYLSIFLAAFYTICCGLSSIGAEANSASTSLVLKICSESRLNWTEANELIFDYLFLLKEEKKTPEERLKALQAICGNSSNGNQFQYNQILATHSMEVLRDFSVTDMHALKELHTALAPLEETPQRISSKEAQCILRLGKEVLNVPTPTPETQRIKASTILHLFLLAQQDIDFGRQLGTMALEEMANCENAPENERRTAIYRPLISYRQRRTSKEDADLLYRNVLAASKIVRQSKNKCLLPELPGIYNEIYKRCSSENALNAQQALVDAANFVNADEKTMHELLLQMACAYIMSGQVGDAEKVLSQQLTNRTPIDNLCLAECLRRQKKYEALEILTEKLAKAQYPSDVQFPSLYVAMANAIRAQALIEQKKYARALPLLIAADAWFSNGVAIDNMELRNNIYIERLLPSEVSVLSNLALVYEKLARNKDALRIRQTLIKAKEDKARYNFSAEKSELENFTSHEAENSLATIRNAKQFIQVCNQAEKSSKKRAELILNYAESLIGYGNSETAQICIDALSGNEYLTGLGHSLRLRLLIDRILIAEDRNDLKLAALLLKELEKHPRTGSSETLRISEVEARYALLAGDFEMAEVKSKPIEIALDAGSAKPSVQYQDSERDKIVNANFAAILDRVQVLNQLEKYSQAARLARLLLTSSNNSFSRTGPAAAANLAFAYAHQGHSGLAEAFEQEAVFKNQSLPTTGRSRYEIDTKKKLAALCELRDNTIRARRYKAEAQANTPSSNQSTDGDH